MSSSDGIVDRHVDLWWRLFAVALFLLVPLDLLTTLLAVTKYGMVVEANPVMRWLLHQGLWAVTVANLVVVCLGVSLFHIAIGGIRRAPLSSHRALAHVVNVWVGTLLVAGVVLVSNNLLILV